MKRNKFLFIKVLIILIIFILLILISINKDEELDYNEAIDLEINKNNEKLTNESYFSFNDAIKPKIKTRFEIYEINDLIKEKMKYSYKDNEHINYSNLRYIVVSYIDYNGYLRNGELVVNEIISQKIVEIFKILLDNRFQIEKMRLVDYYNGDDNLSMKDNNTSAFNYRYISNTTTLSNHALGLAVDINPLYNPYVTKIGVFPPEGEKYVSRDLNYKGMIKYNDCCYNAFISNGFKWGGKFNNVKDYQHFEYSE